MPDRRADFRCRTADKGCIRRFAAGQGKTLIYRHADPDTCSEKKDKDHECQETHAHARTENDRVAPEKSLAFTDCYSFTEPDGDTRTFAKCQSGGVTDRIANRVTESF
jgi:uncharacterized protein YgiB involved in biofilm formation